METQREIPMSDDVEVVLLMPTGRNVYITMETNEKRKNEILIKIKDCEGRHIMSLDNQLFHHYLGLTLGETNPL